MSEPLIGAIVVGGLLFVATFTAIMAPWGKLLGFKNSSGYVPPANAADQQSKRGSDSSEANPAPRDNFAFSLASWICGFGAVVGAVFAGYITTSVPNYGSIASLQAQTNELMYGVIVAILALALAVAAVFFRIEAKR